eukprot:COSAG05_NODE_74_length_21769_cov_194.316290_2_plen_272_part_00
MSTQRAGVTQPLLNNASPVRGGGSGAPFLGRTLSVEREFVAQEQRKCAALKLAGGAGGTALLFLGTLFSFEGVGPDGKIWWMPMVLGGALLVFVVQLSAAFQRLKRERELSHSILAALHNPQATDGPRLVPSAAEQLQILEQVQRQHAPGAESGSTGGSNIALGVVVFVCGAVLLGLGLGCQDEQLRHKMPCPAGGQDRLAMVAIGGCLVLLELAMAAFLTWESINAEAVSTSPCSPHPKCAHSLPPLLSLPAWVPLSLALRCFPPLPKPS